MREVQELLEPTQTEHPARDLGLLIPRDPWSRIFLQNLRDLMRPPELDPLQLESAPADFWPDVFVNRRLPWRRFLQSSMYHVLALLAIWEGSQFLALQRQVIVQPMFTHADVVYYSPSEYLPPLDTRRSDSRVARKADPEYSAQPIISVPPEADNRSQTIVTPPNVRLGHDVALPNVVAGLEKGPDPRMPIGPAPAVPASEISRLAPTMERSVIAPPPLMQAVSRETLSAPRPAVIAPPPDVDAGSTRRVGDLNIGRSSVIAPAPQLSLDEQRTSAGRNSSTLTGRSAQVIAPPPSLGAAGRSHSGGGMIALSLHPAVGAPPEPPAGNRRGNFAATPEGHRGVSGAPGASAGNSSGGANTGSGKSDGNGSGKTGARGVPSGLYVGKASTTSAPVAGDPGASKSSANSVNPRLLANARPPLSSARTMQPEGQSKLSEEERAVFGDRKFYSLSLNMPNLNSAGGSWIIRFAALKADSGSSSSHVALLNDGSGAPPAENLSAPSATRKVDPAYPLELMKQNVAGTVILYAVIHADGTVGGVRVLRSVDERLDQFASDAIAKWKFQPATKNGAPVYVEATFWIPFRPTQVGTRF
jgi:TonB family protein